MKSLKLLTLFGLLLVLTPPLLYAEEQLKPTQTLAQAYLGHWFSYDSKEAINIAVTTIDDDSIGKRAEFTFTSDDGQLVNGKIAYPEESTDRGRLALALHPMGASQNFWWSDKNPLGADKLTVKLRQQGYTVISLDARKHGARKVTGFGPRELIARARSNEPRLYIDTIVGTVRDYRIILNWAKRELKPKKILAMGYSMGAQMSLLLASFESQIDAVIAMVPPYVDSLTSPVSPRIHVSNIKAAKVLWLAGNNDQYSNIEQTTVAFSNVASADKELIWFESAHFLPPEYLVSAIDFLDSLVGEDE